MDNSPEKTEYRPTPGRVFALGTLIPGAILLFAAALIGIWPFGNGLILEVDSIHQYLPFITELRRHLIAGDSLFYSFSGGLGYNLWANLAYYGASPLNYLSVLIPEAAVCDFMVWLILLKVALCGGVFSWYLYRGERGNVFFALSLGTAYALSNFFLGYKFNLMWLDSIAVAPLIMYGIERLVERRGSGVYLLSLFYAIWCNYYIGYILCLFSCLWFLTRLCLAEDMDLRRCVKTVFRFAIASLAAGGMCAILLIPSALALAAADSGSAAPATFKELFYNNGLEMLLAHFEDSMAFRSSYERGNVQLYCGVIVLMLLPLYLLDSGRSLRQRLVNSLLLAFLFFSFSFSPLNYVWHGFHLEVGLPNRFAFLYLLLLLRLCHGALCSLSRLRRKPAALALGAVFALYAAVTVYKAVTAGELRLVLSLALLGLYAVLILLMSRGVQRGLAALLCVLVIAESGGHAVYDLVNKGAYEKTYYTAYQRDFSHLLAAQEDSGYYRSEIDSQNIINFSLYAGGNGLSLFDSTMRREFRELMSAFGMRTRLNTVRYQGSTKLVNDIFGVRYFVTTRIDSDILNGFEKIAAQNGKTLYRNNEALSIGFMVPESLLQWRPKAGKGIDAHNDFARLVCGEEIYRPQYVFPVREGSRYVFDIPENGFVHVKLDKAPKKIMWTNSQWCDKIEEQNYVISASSTKAGESAVMELELKEGQSVTARSWVCTAEDYHKLISALSASQLEDVRIADNRLSGRVCPAEPGVLLITLPWDEGWSARVDGAEAELVAVGGALLGLRLEPGEHSVELCYVPPGYALGRLVSLASAVAAAGLIIIEFFGKKHGLCSR